MTESTQGPPVAVRIGMITVDGGDPQSTGPAGNEFCVATHVEAG